MTDTGLIDELDDVRRGRTADQELTRIIAWLRTAACQNSIDMDTRQRLEDVADELERLEPWGPAEGNRP